MIKAIALLTLLCTANAFAIPIDPAPDHVGVYFDPGATITNLDITPNVPFTVYLILTNTTGSDIWGGELGYQLVVPAGYENSYARLENSVFGFTIDTGNSDDISHGDYMVGVGLPGSRVRCGNICHLGTRFHGRFPDGHLPRPGLETGDRGRPARVYRCRFPAGPGPLIGKLRGAGGDDQGGVSNVPRSGFPDLVLLEPVTEPIQPPDDDQIFGGPAGAGIVVGARHVGPAGACSARWQGRRRGRASSGLDGFDRAGRDVPSGVYFCRIKALGVSEAKRMTLVR